MAIGSDNWNSKLGVVLAVSGSAVGLGNFLKFPGQVAMYGGAAFMVAYVLSFFAVGVPISILEWTIGRSGGAAGFNSPAGAFAAFCRSKKMLYVGMFSAVLTMLIYCYYIYIEAWCLGYAYNFLFADLGFTSLEESGGFFAKFVGAAENGSAFGLGADKVMVFFAVSFFLNFIMIYRGVSKGIEAFCKYAMPTLVLLAIVIVVRMMTLTNVSPEHPERSINQGLGFMWNPVKVEFQRLDGDGGWVSTQQLVGDAEIEKYRKIVDENNAALSGGDKKSASFVPADDFTPPPEKSGAMRIEYISVIKQLANPSIWIAAAGQVFFSLTVGFGAIMTYASYLKKNDDIVLSALTSCSANEFCEVCLGGMITVPAAVAFFGVSGAIGAGLSLFDIGFKVLPLFFVKLPFGAFFGFLFFFLLFLSAVTSSLSMLQPSLALIEEATTLRRKFSTLLLGIITFFISVFVIYCSKDLKAMDTFDFWMGQVAIYVFAMVQTIAFSWFFGAKRGIKLANEGSEIKLPLWCAAIVKYITPTILATVFVVWVLKDVFGVLGDGYISPYILDLFGQNPNPVAWICIMIIAALYAFYAAMIYNSRRYGKLERLCK